MTDRILRGRATPEGTRRYWAGFPALSTNGTVPLGRTGLTIGRVGFGTYRVDDETPDHQAALAQALVSGCNLIDTSTNYTDGGSERLVGRVLSDAVGNGDPPREAVVVVSKIGYVQGENLRVAIERERAGFPFPEMVKYMDGCWHCIHPEFLEDQLKRSLGRLGLETLDVCLLHNPEYFFSDAKQRGAKAEINVLRAEFYRRVREAFAFFEGAVARGEIGSYGVSSNSLVSAADDPEATSLIQFQKAAEEAGGRAHHFRVAQFPMNLYESGGALVVNTGPERTQTALEAASACGLAVLINRPLNAIVANRLIRLADRAAPAQGGSLQDCAAQLKFLEEEYRAQLAPFVGSPVNVIDPFFDLVHQLPLLPPQIEDLEQWREIEQQHVIPRIHFTARKLGQDVPEKLRGRWESWWERCVPQLEGLLQAIGREAARRGGARGGEVAAAIDPLLPAERRGETLSRKAIWTVASTRGVSCVLVGMRRPAYVEDAIGALAWPPLPDPPGVYQRIKQTRHR
jgi:uncharacterized protein